MFKTHTTREGDQMLVAEMSDSHLLNTVELNIRKAETAKGKAQALPTSDYARGLYGVKRVDAEEAGRMVRTIMDAMTPYIAEMWVRGIGDNLREQVQVLLDRQSITMLSADNGDAPF